MNAQTKIKAGTRVTASYRVAPFLAEEILVVVSHQGERCYVQAQADASRQGWLDTDTLTLKEGI